MKFAIICSPVPGHLLPFSALGRELISRGHEVVVPHVQDVGPFVRRIGLDFSAIGKEVFPAGSMAQYFRPTGQLMGFRADLHTLRLHRKIADLTWKELPGVLGALSVDVLLIDQLQPQGAAIAQQTRLPFVTVCPTLALDEDPSGRWPIPVYSFRPARTYLGRVSNRVARFALQSLVRHYYLGQVNADRKTSGLAPIPSIDAALSPRLRLSVFPPALDFNRPPATSKTHVVGPLVSDVTEVDFPWAKLDGRPLVYASLGTLRNQSRQVFEAIGAALSGRSDCQVVLSGGAWSWSPAKIQLPADVIYVPFAPQRALLKRARLCITHGGANTVLESLLAGVPLVALPFGEDQMANALRAEAAGVARLIPASKATSSRIRKVALDVLGNESMHESAQLMGRHLLEFGGVQRAADLILEEFDHRRSPARAA